MIGHINEMKISAIQLHVCVIGSENGTASRCDRIFFFFSSDRTKQKKVQHNTHLAFNEV